MNWKDILYLAQDAGIVACVGSLYAIYLLWKQIVDRKLYNPTKFSTFFSPVLTIIIYIMIYGPYVDQSNYFALLKIVFICVLVSVSYAYICIRIGYNVDIEKAMHLSGDFYGSYFFRFIFGSLFVYFLALFIIFMLYYFNLDCDTSKCGAQRLLLGDGYFAPKAYLGLMMISGNSVWICFCFKFARRESANGRQ